LNVVFLQRARPCGAVVLDAGVIHRERVSLADFPEAELAGIIEAQHESSFARRYLFPNLSVDG
jgi:hypothetical protein